MNVSMRLLFIGIITLLPFSWVHAQEDAKPEETNEREVLNQPRPTPSVSPPKPTRPRTAPPARVKRATQRKNGISSKKATSKEKQSNKKFFLQAGLGYSGSEFDGTNLNLMLGLDWNLSNNYRAGLYFSHTQAKLQQDFHFPMTGYTETRHQTVQTTSLGVLGSRQLGKYFSTYVGLGISTGFNRIDSIDTTAPLPVEAGEQRTFNLGIDGRVGVTYSVQFGSFNTGLDLGVSNTSLFNEEDSLKSTYLNLHIGYIY